MADTDAPVMTAPVHCPKCGRDLAQGSRALYETLPDGNTRWLAFCAACLVRYPPRNPWEAIRAQRDADEPPRLEIVK